MVCPLSRFGGSAGRAAQGRLMAKLARVPHRCHRHASRDARA
jgi:hypothetical protein